MPTTSPTNLACQALQDLRHHLTQLARLGGGEITTGLLQAAADDCGEAVIVTDHKARILMVNGAAARLGGTTTRELQQLTVWDITHATFQSDFDVLWKEFLRAGRQRGQYGIRHKNGSVVEVGYCADANILPERTVIVLRRLS